MRMGRSAHCRSSRSPVLTQAVRLGLPRMSLVKFSESSAGDCRAEVGRSPAVRFVSGRAGGGPTKLITGAQARWRTAQPTSPPSCAPAAPFVDDKRAERSAYQQGVTRLVETAARARSTHRSCQLLIRRSRADSAEYVDVDAVLPSARQVDSVQFLVSNPVARPRGAVPVLSGTGISACGLITTIVVLSRDRCRRSGDRSAGCAGGR